MRNRPDAMLAVVRLLGERLARATTWMEKGQMAAESRLGRPLLRLAALDPTPERAGLTIDLGLSKSDFGDMTGLARESINKVLSGWREHGWIGLAGAS